MILRQIAMKRPNDEGIYAPTEKTIRISMEQFSELYELSAQAAPVSFASDYVSDPVLITAYAHGMNCWYIVEA